MKSSSTTLLIAIITFFTLGLNFNSHANSGSDKGVHYSYTSLRLSPKQFTKGYHAQKRQHESINSSSTKKMLRKRKGSWLQRWYSRNF
jgi:hypothetical protein